MRPPYKAKSLSGAQARVRRLEKKLDSLETIAERLSKENKLLARLAAKGGPAFLIPVDAWGAEVIRDEILRNMNLNPDGTFISRQSPVSPSQPSSVADPAPERTPEPS